MQIFVFLAFFDVALVAHGRPESTNYQKKKLKVEPGDADKARVALGKFDAIRRKRARVIIEARKKRRKALVQSLLKK